MVGQAPTSLVSGDRNFRGLTLRWLGVLDLGFISGSGVIFGLAWFVSTIAHIADATERVRLVILLGLLLTFLAFDLPAAVRGTYSRLGMTRQTPKNLDKRLKGRLHRIALVWGFDIGTGISTYRMTSAIWLALGIVILGLVPAYIGWLYGFGVAASVSLIVVLIGGGARLYGNVTAILVVRRWVQVAYVLTILAIGAVALIDLV